MTVQKLYLYYGAKPFLQDIGIDFEQLDRPGLRHTCLLVTNARAFSATAGTYFEQSYRKRRG